MSSDNKVKIKLNSDEAKDLSMAAQEIQYLTNAVGEVFRMFNTSLVTGDEAEASLVAVSDLCARAMDHACQKEGLVLARFSSRLDDILREENNAA